MTPSSYVESIKERLLSDAHILEFRIVRERATLEDAHIRVRLTLTDESQLEFSEYAQLDTYGQINVVTYSYHWTDAKGDLVRRWDNTPHFPNLSGFPHHIHDAATNAVIPGQPVDIFTVLDAIASQLTH